MRRVREKVLRQGYRRRAPGSSIVAMGQTLLLFSGTHDKPRRGAGDLVGWFDGEDEALAAFRELRLARSDREGWAELVVLDGGPRPSVRAWFGTPRAERRDRHPAGRRHLRLLAR